MKRYIWLALLTFSLLPVLAFGDNAAAVPADPSWLAWLNSLSAKIPTSGILVTVAALAIEFLCRIVKTQKPLSLLYLARNLFLYAGVACHTFATLLDGIYQNAILKENEAPSALNSVPVKVDSNIDPLPKV